MEMKITSMLLVLSVKLEFVFYAKTDVSHLSECAYIFIAFRLQQ